jgi:hypothetical protein
MAFVPSVPLLSALLRDIPRDMRDIAKCPARPEPQPKEPSHDIPPMGPHGHTSPHPTWQTSCTAGGTTTNAHAGSKTAPVCQLDFPIWFSSIRDSCDGYGSGRPRTIFHSRLSRRHVRLGTSQFWSSRICVRRKIVFLFRRELGPSRWIVRKVMLGLFQCLISHSKSCAGGSSLCGWLVGSGSSANRYVSLLCGGIEVFFRFLWRQWCDWFVDQDFIVA